MQALPSSANADAAAAKVPLRMMPLGASLTAGYLSTGHNGFRQDLRNMLTSDGFSIDMVGSRKEGTMQDNDNEGWSGFRIAEIHDRATRSVPGLQPNIFTVNAGTNDAKQNYQLSSGGERLDKMLEDLWTMSPNSTIILSSLIINLKATADANAVTLNKQFRAVAQQKIAQNKRLVYVDFHGPDGPQKKDMADDTHPGDVGYNKLAKILFRGVKEAESKGFLVAPNKA